MSVKLTSELLITIGQHLLEGLTEQEACILAGLSEAEAKYLQENPVYKKFVDKKKVEFKQIHLNVLAKKKDYKTSQWLLERLLPEQFYPSRSKDTGKDDVNIVAAILTQIQSDKNAGPVQELNYQVVEKTNAKSKDKGIVTQGSQSRETDTETRGGLKVLD